MAGHEPKTRATTASVPGFLDRLSGSSRADARTLVRLLTASTGARPKLWGTSGKSAHASAGSASRPARSRPPEKR